MGKRKRKSKEEENINGIKVISIDALVDENSRNHHTDDYETDDLVIRRGTPFSLSIKHQGYDPKQAEFYVTLKTGKHPKQRNGSCMEIQKGNVSKDTPSFQITSSSDKEVRISVHTTADTLVSRYSLTVTSIERNKKKRKRIEHELAQQVFILFNPWNEDDEVYMSDALLRQEYVLSDEGCVFVSGQRWRPWRFGQFTPAALKCTFQLLEKVRPSWRNNAREVARNISSRCNSCDNDGLLVGNWSGEYEGGRKPWEWSGSVAIFEKYLETGEPVKYGQCWVFSGLTTSMMRCLGMPCRSVTNYDSAHDTDNNCTYDKYFDEEWNYMDDESDDSCWNFHVWNDVWMTRPDLPPGFGGWQAMDGTPQEESKGTYRCGPASLQAIREGDVNQPHDTKFIFAEVNADTVYWKPAPEEDERQWEPAEVKRDSVGTAILTKMPNSKPYRTQNVTSDYKHHEGSILERASVLTALKKAKNPAVEYFDKFEVEFSTRVEKNVNCDEPVIVKLKANNNTDKDLEVAAAVHAHVIRYNGVKLASLDAQKNYGKAIASRGDANYEFKYDASMYKEHLDENISLRFVIVARVVGTSKAYITQKICNIQKPDLLVEFSGSNGAVKGGDVIAVKVTVPSIYGVQKYTNASIQIDCPVIDNTTEKVKEILADGSGVIEKSLKIKSTKKAKKCDLVITFNSKEVSGIHGTLVLDVKPSA